MLAAREKEEVLWFQLCLNYSGRIKHGSFIITKPKRVTDILRDAVIKSGDRLRQTHTYTHDVIVNF